MSALSRRDSVLGYRPSVRNQCAKANEDPCGISLPSLAKGVSTS